MLYAGWLVSCYNPETKNTIFKGPFCMINLAQNCAKDLKKQYRNILTKFESIVFGTKYAVDLLEVINIPEVKTYIENQLKSECTTLSCVSKETIDFVKEYLNNDK